MEPVKTVCGSPVDQLEETTAISLPPNPEGQIGISRQWIPKEVDFHSVVASLARSAYQIGFRAPQVNNIAETTVAVGSVAYQRWDAETGVGGPCTLMHRFLSLMETNQTWPTLVVDEVRVGSTNIRPTTVTIYFHIITRASDEPPESREEYERLIADRGAAAAFPCEPIPTLAPTPTPPPTATPTP